VSTAPFNALAASNSQHTYQILVPSLNVFVDRKIVWESGVFLQSAVWPTLPCDPRDGAYSSTAPYTPAATTFVSPPCFGGSASIDVLLQASPESDQYRRTLPANSFPSSGVVPAFPTAQGDYYEIAQPGTNFNLCPFPLQSLCNSMTCSINDCSVTTNGDTLQEQILLTNTRDTQRIRTTPSKFDQYAWTSDDARSSNGNMSALNFQRPASGEIPTGAWPITFYNPVTGTRLMDDPNNCGAYLDPNSNAPVYYFNGRPVVIPGGLLQGAVSTATGGLTWVADAGEIGTGTATLNIPFNNNVAPTTLLEGSMFTITGLTGSNALWNGYYYVASSTQTLVSSQQVCQITFKYGRVVFAADGAVSFRSRSASGTVSASFFVTSERIPSGTGNFSNGPANTISRLLGQVLPSGIQIMPTPMNAPMTVSFLYQVAEPIVMSPFIYQDALEFNNVGLYGCTNIQFTMNIQSPSPNCQAIQQGSWPTNVAPFSVVRTNCDYPSGATIVRTTGCIGAFSNVTLTPPNNTPTTTGAFLNPRCVVQFLTPGPDVSLPLISNVPYMEFPRYTNTYLVADPKSTQLQIQSQTITLSSIPDFIMVYVKARTRCQLQNETYVPVQRVAVTFDNFSNLCSNMTQYELYTCSVAAGLDMDYQTWRGYANASGQQLTNGAVASGVTSGLNTVYGSVTACTIAASGNTITLSILPLQPQIPLVPVVNSFVSLNGISLIGTSSGIYTLSGVYALQAGSTATSFIFTNPVPNITAGAYTPSGTVSLFGGSATGPQSTVLPISSGSWNLGGSKVPYELSSGTANLWSAASGSYNVAGQNKFVPRATTQLTGGPLMLRMGQDVSLSPGLAPGTLGNFSIQLNMTLDNSQHFFDAYSSYQLTIIAVNSGYFETVRGQSAVRKTILNMADVESASVATGVTTSQLRRLVGGARGSTLSNMGMHLYGRSHGNPGMEGGGRKRMHMSGSGL